MARRLLYSLVMQITLYLVETSRDYESSRIESCHTTAYDAANAAGTLTESGMFVDQINVREVTPGMGPGKIVLCWRKDDSAWTLTSR